ncbi:FxSxx-COOH system tetratricopeptide repeat protein [Streptomyces sp. MJP52]|uniref:FxSxx-COOH system tetratricopeptide repeat protein n=1 Tax=Streptomyces sp. MJP52 TaxID=2940555 RepID=UPI002473C9D4|nr:FxSxx-COOH system tetratricopeptide repeat protein [Streptomyces sp. MJP52]MDH6228985.1 tetratricopeptide (TPR) repeat protein [Streptomyces sp. MJP52]
MTDIPGEAPGQQAAAGIRASHGAIAAGGDVVGSSTQYITAGQAFVLPPEAYRPIPDDAADGGISNIASDLFVGRNDELTALKEAFTRPGKVVVHAVHGLGGVGKSALAAHWAGRRPERLRWWVTADDASAVDAGLAALARALQPALAALPAEVQSERAVDWLTRHDGWLLVLDNVEDPRHIRPLLDRLPGGRILITTRRATGWHHYATAIRLGVFRPDESLELFTRVLTHHGPRDTDGADAVCEELGHLALAVEQAAAYCAETGIPPLAYLDLLAQWPATMFAAGAEGGDAERTIARIWHLTLDRLSDTPLAGDLLRVLAWYAPDRIPRSLLEGLAEPPRLAAAIGRLTAYSMITDNGDATWSVHRLVQALARTPDPDDPHRRPEAIDHARDQATTRLADTFPTGSYDQPDTWPLCRAVLPHADALTHHHTPDHDTTRTARVLHLTALYRFGQGALAPAIHALQRALATEERIRGNDHPHTLTTRNNLARAYRSAGELSRAVQLQECTLHDSERVLGNDHPDTLITRNNLAYTYRVAGRVDDAITLGEQVAAGLSRLFGDNSRETLIARSNLASAYSQAGRTTDSIALNEQVAADFARLLGDDHPDTLIARGNLVSSYNETGRAAEAVALAEQVAADVSRVFGKDHPRTLSARANLASSYDSAGLTAEAISLGEQVEADLGRVLGEDHLETLTARANLASSYDSAGRTAEALTLSEQIAVVRTRVLGEDHPDTLTTRANLAYYYHQMERTADAMTLGLQVAAARARVLGIDHPDTLTACHNLAAACRSAGRIATAIALGERVAAARARVLGEDNPDTLTTQANLAHSYQQAGRTADAITLGEQIAAVFARVNGEDHPETLTVRANLATAYTRAGRATEAVILGEQIVAARARVLGEDNPDTLTAQANLASAYASAGCAADAIALQEHVIAARTRVLGKDHLDTLIIRGNLAVTYWDAGRPHDALALLRQVVTERERVLGPDHPKSMQVVRTLQKWIQIVAKDDERGAAPSPR